MKTQIKIMTQIGPLYLTGTEKGLAGVFWKMYPGIPMAKSLEENMFIAQAASQIKEYLDLKRKRFNIALDLEGTEFQKSVWKCLLQIPYGKTCSYTELAQKLKKPKAARAVGNANAKNPLSIIVPCHRVIRSAGELGGYAGGLKIKERLLALEGSMYIKGDHEKPHDI